MSKNIIVLFALIFLLFKVSFGQKKNEHHIYWESERKLTWNDFKIKPRKKRVSHKTSIFAYPKRDPNKSSAYIYSVFHKKYSWVTPEYLEDTSYLEYFQIRFDMFELYSRKVRKAAHQIAQDEAVINKWKEIKKAFNKIMDDGIKEVIAFSKASVNGKNRTIVMQKLIEVRQELENFDQFKNSRINLN